MREGRLRRAERRVVVEGPHLIAAVLAAGLKPVAMLGTAYFHDLGRFITDIENQFPLIRVQNLDVEPAQVLPGAAETTEKEKLSFRLELVALVKPAGQ